MCYNIICLTKKGNIKMNKIEKKLRDGWKPVKQIEPIKGFKLGKFIDILRDEEKDLCCYGCATMRSACTNPNSTNPNSENFNESNQADLENAIGKRGLAV